MHNREFIEFLEVCGKLENASNSTIVRLNKLKSWEEDIKETYIYLEDKKVDINYISIYLRIVREKRFDLGECNEIVVRYFRKFENLLKFKNSTEMLKVMIRNLRISNCVELFEENIRYYLEFKVGAR